jgi:hypothetical protein
MEAGTDPRWYRFGRRENSRLEIERRALDDPERLAHLKDAFRHQVGELMAETNEAGYSQAEAVAALLSVVDELREDPDPADDPQPPKDRAEREDVVAKSALDL